MAATTSKNFGLRFFYFAFACLLYSIWRAVDLLAQVKLTGEYEHSPIVTADNTLTLLKKETEVGLERHSVWVSELSEWLHYPRPRKHSELVSISTRMIVWRGI
jgi:hypothetical protein